jgi:hypothetical protein
VTGDDDVPVAVTTDCHIRGQVVEQVVVGGGEQRADAGAADQLPQVERQHLRQRAVEHGGKFIQQDRGAATAGERGGGFPAPRRSWLVGYRVCDPEPIPLPVAQLGRRSQQQPRLAQAARGQQPEPLLDGARQGVDERHVRQRQGRRVHGVQLLPDFPQQRTLARPARPGEQHQIFGADVEGQVVGDGVRRLVPGQAEQVGHLAGGQAAAGRAERVADGDGREHGKPRFVEWGVVQ